MGLAGQMEAQKKRTQTDPQHLGLITGEDDTDRHMNEEEVWK